MRYVDRIKVARRKLRQSISSLRVSLRQAPLGFHRPSVELTRVIAQAQEVCKVVKNDDVLGKYFLEGNPWSGRSWRQFDYWNGWYALSKLKMPRAVLEIGTAFGFSTIALARGAGKHLKVLVSLDLGNFGRVLAGEGVSEIDNLFFVREGIRRYIRESGAEFEYLQFQVNTQPPPFTDNDGNPVHCLHWMEDGRLVELLDRTRFDLILLDGKHTEDGLYNDLVAFFPYASARSLIICDDLQHRDAFASWKRFVTTDQSEITDYCIWTYLHCDTEYGGALRRDQGLIIKR
jgi:hypothetical protein